MAAFNFKSMFFLVQLFNQFRLFFFYRKDFLQFLTAIFIYLHSLVLLFFQAPKQVSFFIIHVSDKDGYLGFFLILSLQITLLKLPFLGGRVYSALSYVHLIYNIMYNKPVSGW